MSEKKEKLQAELKDGQDHGSLRSEGGVEKGLPELQRRLKSRHLQMIAIGELFSSISRLWGSTILGV